MTTLADQSTVLTTAFYVTGGTLPPDAPSYVVRQADVALLAALLSSEYCYVLNSRQMGKSSLCVRTIGRLKEKGFRTCFLDLTKFGGKNLTAEQWYAALISETGREVGLRAEFVTYWKQNTDVGPMQRFFGALRDLALPAFPQPLVVFVDEIDVTLSLPFSTDEFFAGIRQCFVERAANEELSRLTFCLLGTATPADLIVDTRTSPFNIGKRIEVKDFTASEAAPLAIGLDYVGNGSALLERVLYWTSGHPYLTQRLCRTAAEAGAATPADIDRLCHDLFLSHTAKESDDNLAFVRNRLLKSEADLVALLDMYRQMWQGKRIRDDETNALCSILKLSGVCKVEAGLLKVRNRIYAQVFDAAWVEQHLPDAEWRRQRAAFRRGLSLAGGIAGAVLSVVTLLAVCAIHNAHVARDETARANKNVRVATQKTEEADQNLYIANMNLIQREWDTNNIGGFQKLLAETRARGRGTFEWGYWTRLNHLELLTLKGHTSPVVSVAFSPDGKRILTGSEDNTAKVWDTATGKELFTLKGHHAMIFSVAFSADGKRLLTGNQDNTAKVWDAATGKELLTLKGHMVVVTSVAFSPDGKWIATRSGDRKGRIWDAVTGKELLTLQGSAEGDTSVAFSPDGKRVLMDKWKDGAGIWDASTGQELLTLKGPKGYTVQSVAFSADGKRVLTGSQDNTAKVWDPVTGKELLTLKGHTEGICSVAFSPDSKRIVTGSYDKTAKVWDATNGQELFTFKGHTKSVLSVAFSPDGKRILTGSQDNTAKVWDAANGQEFLTFKKDAAYNATSVAFSSDGKRILTSSQSSMINQSNRIKLFDAATGKELLRIKSFVSSAALSPDGKRLLIGCGDGTVNLRDAVTGKELLTVKGNYYSIQSVAFSPDGQRIVTGSCDKTAKVWDTQTGKELLTLKGHGNAIFSVAFSPNGKRIVTGSWDDTAKVWDAANGQEQFTLKGHTDSIWSVAFSADGKRIATSSDDHTGKIWDAMTGKELLTLNGHNARISAISFSPDGRRVLTGSDDRTAKIWDATNGQEVLTLNGHTSEVNSVAFSPDGKRIIAGCSDNTVKVWFADDTRVPIAP